MDYTVFSYSLIFDSNLAGGLYYMRTDGKLPIDLSPLAALNKAVAKVPQLKWAMGVMGVAAVVAIVLSWIADPQKAVYGIIITIALMYLLAIFGQIDRIPGFHWLAAFIAWSVAILFVIVLINLIKNYQWEGSKVSSDGPSSTKSIVIDSPALSALPAALVKLKEIIPEGVYAKISGSIENAPASSRVWVFGRHDQTGNWRCLTSTNIGDLSWSAEFPVRLKYDFPGELKIIAITSINEPPSELSHEVLPASGVSEIRTINIPQHDVQITYINDQRVRTGTMPRITPYSTITIKGISSYLFRDENIWVEAYGKDPLNNDTARWKEKTTVRSDGMWTINLPIGAGKTFEVFALVSENDPGAKRPALEPVICTAR
jgi:hypothetical protein